MVFISYSSCDRVIAEALLNYLENRGIKCWIAFRDITSGNFSGEITRALRNSDIMVVVCSKESCRSEHVKNEVTLAFNKHKHLIPYLLEDNPFDDDLEYFLSLKQYIKTKNDQKQDFALIEKFIRDYRAAQGEPADAVQSAAPVAPVAPTAPVAPVAPVTPVAPAPATEEKKKGSLGLVIGIVAAVLLLGGGGAFFLLKKPSEEKPVAETAVAETAVAEKPAEQPVVTEQAKEQTKEQVAEVKEQPKTQETAKTTTSSTTQQSATVQRKPENDPTPKVKPNANVDTFSGSVINGYPNGFGTYTYKVRRRIDVHDPEERYAEPGDYIKGDWKDGHLNYGEWYGADGVKKAFIRLGDNPDNVSDQKLGKCVKK